MTKYITIEEIKNGYLVTYGIETGREDSVYYETLDNVLPSIKKVDEQAKTNLAIREKPIEYVEEEPAKPAEQVSP